MVAFRELILAIMAVVVVLFFVVLAPAVPAKAYGAISVVDAWLADRGLDLGLIARATGFNAEVQPDDPYKVVLGWKPKNAEDISGYRVDSKYGKYPVEDKDLLAMPGLDITSCTGDLPSCGCNLFAASNCEITKQTGGQYQFTLNLMKDTKVLTSPPPIGLKFYTDEYLQSLDKEGIPGTMMPPTYLGSPERDKDYKSNVNLCKFRWIWSTASMAWQNAEPGGSLVDLNKGALSTTADNTMKSVLEANEFKFAELPPRVGFISRAAYTYTNRNGQNCVINMEDLPLTEANIIPTDEEYEANCRSDELTAVINRIYGSTLPGLTEIDPSTGAPYANTALPYAMFLIRIASTTGAGTTTAQAGAARSWAADNYAACTENVKEILDSEGWQPVGDFRNLRSDALIGIGEIYSLLRYK
ncbi:MAG: hypothetical protein V1702_05845 [Candidatus Woesearchaeota archaeon]